MTIYLDIVLIENLCMNYIILFATAYLLKIKANHVRLILSAILGGIYSIQAYIGIMKIYSNFVFKIVLSILMVYIAYKPIKVKYLAKQIVFFYLVSFVFGGCAFALLYIIKPQEILIRNGMLIGTYPLKVAILGGLLGFTITSIAFKFVKNKLSRKDIYCEISINFNEKVIITKALVDTGNMLKEPITGAPVIIVEKEILQEILPEKILNNIQRIIGGDVPKEIYEDENLEYVKKFRVIPFSSIGKENGMLLGVKADKVEIQQEDDKKIINNVIVGIYEKKLSKKDKYFALIGLDLLEESEEKNELFANVSR